MQFILLTKSIKRGGLCTAGIRLDNGRWIRIVSSDPQSEGAIRRDRVAHVQCLQRVDVPVLAARPDGCQTENFVEDPRGAWTALSYCSMNDLFSLHPPDRPRTLFGNTLGKLNRAEAAKLDRSLIMLEVTDLSVYPQRHKTRASFVYRDTRYADLSVTDPAYFECGRIEMSRALIVVSLPNKPFDYDGCYYKFIAAIYHL